MIKILIIFLFFLIPKTFAFDAVVIVLETPLLKEPKMSSAVLQTLRKGERVYVPREIGIQDPLPEFIQTYDRVGNIAYVPSRYIKVITNDLNESKSPISLNHDPTDYRLEEPIPSSYPFDDTSFLRTSLSLSLAPNAESSYDYESSYHKQTFTSQTGLKLNVTRKISFDRYDRYYFGLTGAILSTGNDIRFDNGSYAKESRSVIKAGPIITYDVYKTHRYRLTLGTGFTYDYHKTSLVLRGSNGDSEERWFTGFSLTPFTNMMAQMTDVFPNVDLIAGADLNFNLPYSQKAQDPIALPELWGNGTSDQIQSGFKAQAAFLLGVQVRY